MQPEVLLVSTMPDAGLCASILSDYLKVGVELASTPRQGIAALRRTGYSVVVIEQSLAERDAQWAETIWQEAGAAVPLEINLSLSSRPRLLREVKATLARRAREMALARNEAVAALGSTLKGSLTGLLLQTQLTLQEPNLPALLTPRLKHLIDLTVSLRDRLDHACETPTLIPRHRLSL